MSNHNICFHEGKKNIGLPPYLELCLYCSYFSMKMLVVLTRIPSGDSSNYPQCIVLWRRKNKLYNQFLVETRNVSKVHRCTCFGYLPKYTDAPALGTSLKLCKGIAI